MHNRKNWLFAGSEAGGAAAIYPLIETAKLNDIEPQAYIADVIAKMASLSLGRTHAMELDSSPATADRRSRIIGGFQATLTLIGRTEIWRSVRTDSLWAAAVGSFSLQPGDST